MAKVNKTKENRTAVYVLRRYLLLCAGLAIMAFGVAFSIKASLGTSPISSVPYVVSLEVKAGVVVLAGEGVVLAVCKVLSKWELEK